ncbi:ATP-grasp domain-containing protein [Pantoea sp. S18]|uniref:ATP-grasp domain-containing protein n=1 Tax=Pantoea sp. S18 TaxID=3019892 RepID=UPI002B204988|nr:ATP-grasp domain-containing protein [Pantoea sp. S18]MEA5100861.1 ATP-grasp domain-containing protein [Pantoea sp. S18]
MSTQKKNLAIICQNRKLAFVFDEAQAMGVEITFFYNENEPPPPVLPAVVRSIALPLFDDEEEAINKVMLANREHPIDGVLTLFEPALDFAAKIAHQLGLPFLPEYVVEQCRNKNMTRRVLHDNGLNTPSYIELKEGEYPNVDQIKFPLVVKPTNGFSSQGVTRANNHDELKSAIDKVWEINNTQLKNFIYDKGGVLLESFIDGPEFAIETFSHCGEVTVLSIGDKGNSKGPYFEEGVYIAPANIDEKLRDEIADEVRRALKALGISEGPAHVELRIDHKQKPFVIEVAPRVGGSGISHYIVKASTDINFLQLVICQAFGMEIPIKLELMAKSIFTAGNYIIPVQGSGIFIEIDGLANLREKPEVQYVFEFMDAGHKVLPYPHFSGYPGFILTRHTDHAACEVFYYDLQKSLKIKYL